MSSLPRLPGTSRLALVSNSSRDLLYEAFERALPAALRLGERELIPLNIDLPRAVTVAVGALPRILTFRGRALTELPTIEARDFDDLYTYALAAAHAHARVLAASRSEEDVKGLHDRAASVYDVLYSDGLALAKRALLPTDSVGKLQHRAGYQRTAFDLLALAAVFRQEWNNIASRTALTIEELDHAEALAEQLLAAVATRSRVPRQLAEVAEQRLRCFTLFVKAYDQVRRALTFLRWAEGDAELIAPSLYGGRKSRLKKETEQADT